MIKVQGNGGQYLVSEPVATNAEANRRNVHRVTSGYVWHGADKLASIEADGLYSLTTSQKFVATSEDGKPCYLDGQSLYLRFELVNGGARITGEQQSDAVTGFKKLAGYADATN